MSRGFAVFIILALISIVFSYVIPDNSGRHVTNAISSYVVADEEDKLSYDEVRDHIRMPVELPFTYSFDEKEFDNGFEYEFSPNIKSGYLRSGEGYPAGNRCNKYMYKSGKGR